MRCVYPGSFDPLTIGHADIIRRAAGIFDEVVVAVLRNGNKKSIFTLEQRIEFLKLGTQGIENIKICAFEGLLCDFLRKQSIRVVVRGVRQASDYEYETIMAGCNKNLLADMETVFLPANMQYSHISSGVVRELLLFGADISTFVPDTLAEKIYDVYYDINGGRGVEQE